MNVYVRGLVEGLMVYWDEVEDAARYYVHLFIGKTNDQTKEITYKEIALVDVERNFKYYSFKGLSRINNSYGRIANPRRTGPFYSSRKTNLNYFVEVEAENRNGSVIDKSDKFLGRVIDVIEFRDIERD